MFARARTLLCMIIACKYVFFILPIILYICNLKFMFNLKLWYYDFNY